MENKEYNIEYKCPCCNKYTFYDLYDICPYCFWENDPIQLDNPYRSSGANKVSLIGARENFIKYGTSEKRFVKCVKK